MIDYIVAAGVFLSGVYQINSYANRKQFLKEAGEALAENKRLLNILATDENMDKLVRIIQEEENNKKSSKFF